MLNSRYLTFSNSKFHCILLMYWNTFFFPSRIGLCGFDNPMRDAKTEEIKKHIGHVRS